MKTIDFSHFIERYITGEMGHDEKQWFEKELEGNRSLRAEVDLRKQTDLVLKSQDVMSLRNKLSAIEKKRKEADVAPRSTSKPTYIKSAALITAILVIGSMILLTGRKTGSEDLISNYYKTYEPPTVQRSAQVAENPDFTIALEFYNTNDFANAALFFSKVVDNNPRDMQSILLSGVSNFEQQKYPEAKRSFVSVIDDNNNLFIETAKWYLALCYIRTGDKEKASGLLRTLASASKTYGKDARKMLKNLK
jgi:TolA-binding protein